MVSSALLLLAALSPACDSAAPPPVFFNHTYAVLDSATIAAITASRFITDTFAGFETRTTHANGGDSWTGSYVYGRETYVELFSPGQIGAMGDAGLGLGIECVGGVRHLAAVLNGRHIAVDTGTRTKLVDGAQVPWFRMAWFPPADTTVQPRMTAWLMEYVPGFMVYRDSNARDTRITRARYATKTFKPARMLDNIVGATYALDSAETNELTRELTAYGWHELTALGAERRFESDGVLVSVLPAIGTKHGLVKLDMRLTRTAAQARLIQLGNSTLTLGAGRNASWEFAEPPDRE